MIHHERHIDKLFHACDCDRYRGRIRAAAAIADRVDESISGHFDWSQMYKLITWGVIESAITVVADRTYRAGGINAAYEERVTIRVRIIGQYTGCGESCIFIRAKSGCR